MMPGISKGSETSSIDIMVTQDCEKKEMMRALLRRNCAVESKRSVQ